MKSMPHVNDTITYRMRLAEKPVDPLRLWHGKVIEVREPVCWVRLTDKGYEGMRELVIFCNYSATKRGGRRGEPTMAERKAVKR